MAGFSALDFTSWDSASFKNHPAYIAGNALGWLHRGDKHASTQHLLSGRLYFAKSGWLLLSVPNALVRGVYDALAVPGVELPRAGALNVPNVDAELLNAHISVMTADEVAAIGESNISERGHAFKYSLGQLCEINPKKIAGVSRLWIIKVTSPDLVALRKSYGLSPLPHGDHSFHITVALRKSGVLQSNAVSKGGEPAAPNVFANPASRGELKAAAEAIPERDQNMSRPGQKDVLHGGAADNLPDREFSPSDLAEGIKHERKHTDNDQIAKEIAKDHLHEEPTYYEEHKEAPEDGDVKKAYRSPYNPYKSMYVQEALNHFNRRAPLIYDHNKPVFQNIRDQLLEMKRRGDFVLRTQRNHEIYRSQVDPMYRHQLGLQAIRGEAPMPALSDRLIERYGDGILASLGGGKS